MEEIPLDVRRVMLWDTVKRRRDEMVAAGVTVPGIGTFDSDPASMLNVCGAALGALISIVMGQPFKPITWTLADNTTVELDANAFIAIGGAFIEHAAACHANTQAKRALLEAAKTPDDLARLSVEAGWPRTNARAR